METNSFPEHLLDHNYCDTCPYFEQLSPCTIPGGVPHNKCNWLDIDDDPLFDDGYKICQTDFNLFSDGVVGVGAYTFYNVKGIYGFNFDADIEIDDYVKWLQNNALNGIHATIYYGKHKKQGFGSTASRVMIHFDTKDDENMFLMRFGQ